MPNHVTNIIVAPQEVTGALLNEDGHVDFSRIIPEPPNIEKGNCPGGNHPPGVICWYEWNIENWGTKWNGFQTSFEDGALRFETAWSHPDPVIKELSIRFPTARIVVKYADEDIGRNFGDYTIVNGDIVAEHSHGEDFSDEAKDFACLVKGYDAEEWRREQEEE